MTAALDRRLEKLETALSPTEAVAWWLSSAKSFGGYEPYSDHLKLHPEDSPLLTLPPLVAAWAGHAPPAKPDRQTSELVERALRSLVVRVILVERCNKLICFTRACDHQQIALLRLLEGLVLEGRVDLPAEAAWVNQVGQLLADTRTWLASAAIIGARYLGGQSPFFADVLAFLEWVQSSCEEMLLTSNQATTRARKPKPKHEPGDLSPIDQYVVEATEPHVAELVRLARFDAEVFLGERTRAIGISRLIELGDRPPWQR